MADSLHPHGEETSAFIKHVTLRSSGTTNAPSIVIKRRFQGSNHIFTRTLRDERDDFLHLCLKQAFLIAVILIIVLQKQRIPSHNHQEE